uniref:Uncharacterized protein n=1 Tax=Rhizophagus irregularis (strain DAOM 181602 / DAOM 197198 / MUCL 43194) TaxID=747089 RepID=U9TKM3_RHIID
MTISWKGKEARVPVECQLVSDAKQIEEVEKESSKEEVEKEIEILIYDDEFHESIKYYDKDFPVFGS